MKVFVTGATGVMGRAVVEALHEVGHHVVALARRADCADDLERLGAEPARGNLFDLDAMTHAMSGCDVVCNLATHVPVGSSSLRDKAWRVNDRIRVEGSRVVAEAARLAGAERLVQESVSSVYADAGEQWVTEQSPVAVSRAAEPAIVAETHVQRFDGPTRTGVVLRFGSIIGDDALTRWRLARARSGHAVGVGHPDGWTHVVHPDDVGTAVVAALAAPAGTYNVGAEPLRRRDLVAAFAEVAGQSEGSFHRGLYLRLAGERVEWLTRSQRVSSESFQRLAAWAPTQPEFSTAWLRGLADVRSA